MIPSSYSGLQRVCLIGGGDLVPECAALLRGLGYEVCAVLAPRHAAESLAYGPGTLQQRLAELGIRNATLDDINTADLHRAELVGPQALALCFGPSWIFSAATIASFGFGMINVNPIPVPSYLGGAHYTWQILNDDRSGGCFLQAITTELDRGPILFQRSFEVPRTAQRPSDYFRTYFGESRRCVQEFFEHVRAGSSVQSRSYADVEQDRLYFPRLLTIEHGYIDWSWSALEIERFCNAFDDPYPGAMTFLDGTRIHLKGVELLDLQTEFHPFTAGLIVRVHGGRVVVAARGGAVHFDAASVHAGVAAVPALREGRRLITPRERLEGALAFRPRLTSHGFQSQ